MFHYVIFVTLMGCCHVHPHTPTHTHTHTHTQPSLSESGNSTEIELMPQEGYRPPKKISLTSRTTTSDMIAEPTPQGGGYSGRGMKKDPKLDSVVISNYQQKADSPQSRTAQEKPPPTRTGKQASNAPTPKQQMKPSKASPTVTASQKQKTGAPPAADESTDSTPKGQC